MREYAIEGLPHHPMVWIDQVPRERLPRIIEVAVETLQKKGYRPKDPARGPWHLMGDLNKPPRFVAELVASQAVKRLQFAGIPPTHNPEMIIKWLQTLNDEALLSLFRECVLRDN